MGGWGRRVGNGTLVGSTCIGDGGRTTAVGARVATGASAGAATGAGAGAATGAGAGMVRVMVKGKF
jgi:hypothetical protein